MQKVKCVYWDVDGTLADTEMGGHRCAFNYAFKEAQLDWYWDIPTYADLLKIQGGINRIRSYGLSNGAKLEESNLIEIHSRKQFYYQQQILKGKVFLRTGVLGLVEQLNSRGIAQWIVTTSSRNALQSLIDSSFNKDIAPFNGAITYEDVEKHKPYPDAYIKAISKSCIAPPNSIVIEDSLAGLLASTTAGISCILTLPPWNKLISNQMKHASAVLNHLGDSRNPCTVFQGPSCRSGKVTIDYLESIINRE